ncbi:MAG: IS21 family transposase, partial [Candidatus Krumholzibacteriia bacterium]
RPRAPKASKLDGFEDAMRRWLEQDPKLTAVRCLEKLRDQGFDGAYTIVRQRLRALRREVQPPAPTATPVETAPGQRGEFDWSPYRLAGGVKVQLFHAVLRWSRGPSLAAATNTRQTTTLRLLRTAMEELGGVPEEWLTDSMPGFVDRWELDEPILNARYVDFAAHYDFRALIGARGCAKAKAVAERRFRHHENNLLVGRRIHSFEEYARLLAWWKVEKVLKRPHPETGRPIAEMVALERAHLKPLPARPYDTRDVAVRLVDDYQRVRFDTNHYPVPAPVGSRIYVCADTERIEMCDHQARRLIEHERLPTGARIKLPPLHAKRVRYDLDELGERVGLWGEVAAAFAAGVRRARRYPGPELVRVLQLNVNWSADDIVAAMEHAINYRCYEVGKLGRILEARFTPRRFEDVIAESTRARIHEVMKAHPVTPRPLASYETLEKGDRSGDELGEEDGGDGARS